MHYNNLLVTTPGEMTTSHINDFLTPKFTSNIQNIHSVFQDRNGLTK